MLTKGRIFKIFIIVSLALCGVYLYTSSCKTSNCRDQIVIRQVLNSPHSNHQNVFAPISKQLNEAHLSNLFNPDGTRVEFSTKDHISLHDRKDQDIPSPGNKSLIQQRSTHSSFPLPPPLTSEFHRLSPSDVAGVDKFVFFVGYGRSGHSMVAGIMDAHPDVIVAHEFYLFDKLANIRHRDSWNKQTLFNRLYFNSFISAKTGWRSNKNTSKGYNLNLAGSWQGQFRKLRVIGDKTAGATAMQYHVSESLFKMNLKRLGEIAGVPIRIVHVVRNPYDMVATVSLYQASPQPDVFKVKASRDQPYRNATALKRAALNIQNKAMAVQGIAKISGVQMLEIHLEDLIQNSKKVIKRICDFLEISCSNDYVQMCQRKLYNKVSQSRHHVVWSSAAKKIVERMINRLPFFDRYSFIK